MTFPPLKQNTLSISPVEPVDGIIVHIWKEMNSLGTHLLVLKLSTERSL